MEDDELRAFYSIASVYVSLSEHEGFCAPLLEAMAFGVPVLAFDAGAVAETLGGAGVLVRDKGPEVVAALVRGLVTDAGLRRSVLAGQTRRLSHARATDVRGSLLAQLRPLVG